MTSAEEEGEGDGDVGSGEYSTLHRYPRRQNPERAFRACTIRLFLLLFYLWEISNPVLLTFSVA